MYGFYNFPYYTVINSRSLPISLCIMVRDELLSLTSSITGNTPFRNYIKLLILKLNIKGNDKVTKCLLNQAVTENNEIP